MAIASTAALTINAADLDSLRKASDMKTAEYQKIWKQLNLIRVQNPEILYIFIQRPTEDRDIWEFVVDADSNYYLPEYYDNNNDGKLDESDEGTAPGTKNYWPYTSSINIANGPFYEISTPNQWCECISGIAPIRNSEGNVVAILEVDKDLK